MRPLADAEPLDPSPLARAPRRGQRYASEGRSPGLRLQRACLRLPSTDLRTSGVDGGSRLPLTVAGAAAALAPRRTIAPAAAPHSLLPRVPSLAPGPSLERRRSGRDRGLSRSKQRRPPHFRFRGPLPSGEAGDKSALDRAMPSWLSGDPDRSTQSGDFGGTSPKQARFWGPEGAA